MHFLFETEADSLDDFFTELDEELIEECCDQKIYHRGEDYYEQNLVKSAIFNHNRTSLEAIVKGSEKYTVTIDIQHGEVHGECDCPYDDVCKHIVATLFYVFLEEVDDGLVIEAKNIDYHQSAKDYLRTLSKQQLIDLVLKYAPGQFFTSIVNKSKDEDTSKKIFEKVKKDLQKVFTDDELLYEMEDFDGAVNHALSKLSGLETQLRKEIQNLIVDIVNKVDELTGEGYLYNDYYDECYEPSQPFFDFIENYAKTLSFLQKTDFFHKLNEALSRQEYGTFDELLELSQVVYNENDLPMLKNTLMDCYLTQPVSLTINYYQQVISLLNKDERKTILEQIKDENEKWLFELAGLFKTEGNLEEAIAVTKNWINDKSGFYLTEKVYTFYLDLLKEANFDLTEVAKDALTKCPSNNMLKKILSLTNKNITQYEAILKEQSAQEMLIYFEQSNRLDEALELLKSDKRIWYEDRNSFFKKHKRQFPEEATSFFTNVINKNLPHTGNNYYYTIAEAIKNIKEINPGLAKEFLAGIRMNYKRRPNLMKVLEKF